MLSVDPSIFFRCYYNFFRHGRLDLILQAERRNVENVILRLPGRVMDFVWERWQLLPAEFFLGAIDVLHVPYEFLPRVRSAKTVVTVHDVTFLKHPEYLDPFFVKLHTKRINRIVERADCIITDSENTKKELVDFTGADEKRVRVIMLGVDKKFHPVPDKSMVSKVTARYGINDEYVLFVGSADEDKNLVRLISAFAAIRSDYPDLQMVLAGGLNWGYERLMKRLVEMRIDKGVVCVGFVDDVDLPFLYSGARMLAIPSIHEGFGLPAVEAMACGTPVLCSNVSSLPEIVGDSGIQVDPYSTDAVEQGLRRLLGNDDLVEACVAKGLERARMFTWENTARQVVSVYKDLVK